MKKALTYTIIAGNKACPNDCPICISKMTSAQGIDYNEPTVKWDVFDKATGIALNHNAEYALITGKGEPTLYPAQISRYLIELEKAERKYSKFFNRKELQTGGSLLAQEGQAGKLYGDFLDVWKDLGLDIVAVSIYHYDDQKNENMFRPKNGNHYELSDLIDKIHSKDLKIRLSCVMLKDNIDSVEEARNLIGFAKDNDIFQLTLRTADVPKNPLDSDVARFVEENRIGCTDTEYNDIANFLKEEGSYCDTLPHGALVYEVDEQNVSITTGLSNDAGKEEIRQLIYFPQGWLTTSWENVQGSRIL